MQFRRLLSLFGLLTAAGAASAASVQVVAAERDQPRLAILLSIDQCRGDYITRFRDLYLPPRTDQGVGGFRYLQSRGAWYPDCQYQHHRTVTGAGHAILGTGAQPYVSGIVGNDWWDRTTRKTVYCTDDPNTTVVGAQRGSKEKPMSAANLLVTTVGDELELATGGRARTVSVSLKDRASILMSGHRTDSVVWFDETTGGWVSSGRYSRDGRLPGWAQEINGRQIPQTLRQRPWMPSVNAAALARVWKPAGGGGTAFSHALSGDDFGAFTLSPLANQFVFETARAAVEAEQLGQDAIPDLLTINLASNDYVGHRWGPDSAEVVDISVQTDRQLSQFLNFLDRAVPGGLANVTIALSSDHGVANVPELLSTAQVPAGRAVVPTVQAAAQKALETAVGPATWIGSMANGEIYFHPDALARYPREPRARLEEIVIEALSKVPGVYHCFGRSAILSGRAPDSPLGRRMTLGVHPTRSGDVVVVLDPHWLPSSTPIGTGTSHGSPFTYDTHVPLLVSGFGIRPGTYGKRVSPAQVAPTLSHLLGVARPSAADEPLLPGLKDVDY